MNNNLRAEPRPDKTGKVVTRHVRDSPKVPAASRAKLAGARPTVAKTTNPYLTHFSDFDPKAAPREGYEIPTKTETRDGTVKTTRGSKYSGSRDIADIKKDVEVDLKEAVEAGYLPAGIKVRLKTGRAARVQSMSANIEGLPDNVIYSGEKNHWGGPAYSELAEVVQQRVSDIVGAYDSSYTDYQSDGGGCVYYSGAAIVDAEQADYALQQAAERRRAREAKIEASLA
jgi:hypothetical protein